MNNIINTINTVTRQQRSFTKVSPQRGVIANQGTETSSNLMVISSKSLQWLVGSILLHPIKHWPSSWWTFILSSIFKWRQCSAVQSSAVQCSAVQCNAKQCSALLINWTGYTDSASRSPGWPGIPPMLHLSKDDKYSSKATRWRNTDGCLMF